MTQVAQWTIDPRLTDADGKRVSETVRDKSLRAFEERVVVRTDRRAFRVRSWTLELEDLDPADRRVTYCTGCRTKHNGLWYHVVIAAAPDGWKATCTCLATGWCHHGFAAALFLAAAEFDGKVPVPGEVKRKPGKRVRSRPLTVIPGGKL